MPVETKVNEMNNGVKAVTVKEMSFHIVYQENLYCDQYYILWKKAKEFTQYAKLLYFILDNNNEITKISTTNLHIDTKMYPTNKEVNINIHNTLANAKCHQMK